MDGEKLKKGSPSSAERNPVTIQSHASWLRDAIKEIPDAQVIDIGCGRGVYEECLEHDGLGQICGLDMDRSLLKHCCKANNSGDYVQGKAEELPLRDDGFDAAMMIDVFEHIPDSASALREAQRILRPGGKLLITAPNRGFPFLTHGVLMRGKWFDDILGLPFPMFPYLPKPLLRRIWSARCYTAREFDGILRKNGFLPEQVLFLMPALDGVSPAMATMPSLMRRVAQRAISRFNYKQSSWFGSTIAVVARKKP